MGKMYSQVTAEHDPPVVENNPSDADYARWRPRGKLCGKCQGQGYVIRGLNCSVCKGSGRVKDGNEL